MGYQKDRTDFLFEFSRTFPHAHQGIARALLRDATGAQRYNEITSSIEISEREAARLEKRDNARTARVQRCAAMIGAKLDENGDPRGCPFVLIAPDGHKVYVPGNGLPARCFR